MHCSIVCISCLVVNISSVSDCRKSLAVKVDRSCCPVCLPCQPAYLALPAHLPGLVSPPTCPCQPCLCLLQVLWFWLSVFLANQYLLNNLVLLEICGSRQGILIEGKGFVQLKSILNTLILLKNQKVFLMQNCITQQVVTRRSIVLTSPSLGIPWSRVRIQWPLL